MGLAAPSARSAPLTIVSTNTNVATCGLPNGTIVILVTGGTPPYSYSIDGAGPQANDTFHNVLGGVSYTIEVEDSENPAQAAFVIVGVGNIPGPVIDLEPIPATCVNNDGEIDVIVTGGTPSYQFSANGGQYGSANLLTGLATGNQLVTVKDGNGCLATQATIIPLTNDLTLNVAPGVLICQGTGTTLQLTTNATTFSWLPTTGLSDPAAANPVASPQATTTYSVTATLGVCSLPGVVTIGVLPAPVPVISPVAEICFGKSTQLNGSGGVSYEWSPSTYLSSTTIPDPLVQNPQSSITYTLNVTDVNGCKSIQPATVQVVVTPPPVVFAGDDTAILIGQTLPLDAVDVDNVGFTSYQWSPAIALDNPSIQDPVATITTDITYTVTATTPAGCLGTASIKILAVTASDIVVPNAFTPNGDGHNDVFRVHAIGIKDFKYLRVFNRWGQQVFNGVSEGAGWDGTVGGQAQPMGTYVWVTMGLDFSGRVVERRGTVILVR